VAKVFPKAGVTVVAISHSLCLGDQIYFQRNNHSFSAG
jgi:hypothetical protein